MEPRDYIALDAGASKKKKMFIALGAVLGVIILLWFWFGRGQPESAAVPGVEAPGGAGLERTTAVKMPPDDQDGDGLKDEEEEQLGTSLLEFDTDADGLTDKTEIEQWKTDPNYWDSDGDGFADGYEVINGFNPAGPGKLSQSPTTNP